MKWHWRPGRPLCVLALALFALDFVLIHAVSGKEDPAKAWEGRDVTIIGRVADCTETSRGVRVDLINTRPVQVSFSYEAASADGSAEVTGAGASAEVTGADTSAEVTGAGASAEVSGADTSVEAAAVDVSPETSDTDISFEQVWERIAGKEKKIQADLDTGAPEFGSTVMIRGKIRCFDRAANPGCFDAFVFYRSHGCVFRLEDAKLCRSDAVSGEGRIVRLFQKLRQIRNSLKNSYHRILPARDAGLLSALTLGDRSQMDEEAKKLFQEGGISHILAISGLHIQLLGISLYRFLRKRRASFILSAGVSGSFLLAYCILTGMGTSAVRAGIMFLLWLGAQILGRSTDTLTSLAAAAIVLLLRNPYLVEDASFYLSFGSILSISLLTGPAEKLLPAHCPGKNALAVSLAVNLGLAPLSTWFFYQLTPWSVFLNLLVLPCMGVLFLSGFGAGMIGLAIPCAGTFLGSACHYLLQIFLLLCRVTRRLPFGVFVTGRPAPAQIAVYYLLLTGTVVLLNRCERKKKDRGKNSDRRKSRGQGKNRDPEKSSTEERELRFSEVLRTGRQHRQSGNEKPEWLRKKISAWCCVTSALFILLQRPSPGLAVTFLDVGQGDCALLRSGCSCILIDCGSSTRSDLWERYVGSCLKYYGVRELDGVFISHGDADHINGITEYMENYQYTLTGKSADGISIRSVFTAADAPEGDEGLLLVEKAAEKAGIPVEKIRCMDRILAGNTILTCLHPGIRQEETAGKEQEKGGGEKQEKGSGKEQGRVAGDPNQNSMVLLAQYEDVQIFFTGDLESEGEEEFLHRYKEWKDAAPDEENRDKPDVYTVLKVGHHGSANATSAEMLACIRPDIGVISCGLHNIYGHPAPDVLERLAAAGVQVHRTDLEGGIGITVHSLSGNPFISGGHHGP